MKEPALTWGTYEGKPVWFCRCSSWHKRALNAWVKECVYCNAERPPQPVTKELRNVDGE